MATNRTLKIDITVKDSYVRLDVFDSDCGRVREFIVNDTKDKEMALKIGDEVLSWCEVALEYAESEA